MILYTVLYRLGISAYFTAIRIAALFNSKARLFVDGRKGLLQIMSQTLAGDTRKRIWMHCASLGEFEQGRPVLEALRERYPEYTVVVTFFSPSGYEVRKNYNGADHVFYLPMDTNANAKSFLDIVQPDLCLFIKYEFWYYYLANIAARKIPAILVSAIFNKDQGFFKWYGGLQRKMLHCFSHIFVQDAASLALLERIKIKNASISGDTRFDRVIKAAEHHEDLPVLAAFAEDKKIIVAGSTWKEDETFLCRALATLPVSWKLVLVPHEVNIEHISAIENLFGAQLCKWSEVAEGSRQLRDCRVLLVDRVGFLLQIYRYGTVAWIGGGFGKEGVHNVLEAAVYGITGFYGPIYHQFLEAKELIEAGGAFTLSEPTVFSAKIQELDANHYLPQHGTSAKRYVYGRGGATKVVMDYCVKLDWL